MTQTPRNHPTRSPRPLGQCGRHRARVERPHGIVARTRPSNNAGRASSAPASRVAVDGPAATTNGEACGVSSLQIPVGRGGSPPSTNPRSPPTGRSARRGCRSRPGGFERPGPVRPRVARSADGAVTARATNPRNAVAKAAGSGIGRPSPSVTPHRIRWPRPAGRPDRRAREAPSRSTGSSRPADHPGQAVRPLGESSHLVPEVDQAPRSARSVRPAEPGVAAPRPDRRDGLLSSAAAEPARPGGRDRPRVQILDVQVQGAWLCPGRPRVRRRGKGPDGLLHRRGGVPPGVGPGFVEEGEICAQAAAKVANAWMSAGVRARVSTAATSAPVTPRQLPGRTRTPRRGSPPDRRPVGRADRRIPTGGRPAGEPVRRRR